MSAASSRFHFLVEDIIMVCNPSKRCAAGRICCRASAAIAILAAVCTYFRVQTDALAGESETVRSGKYVAESLPALTRPQGEGAKYAKLLRTLTVEDDRSTYGDFYDDGYWSGTEYKGNRNLPAGYWVYVAPHWYIFGEAAAPPATPLGAGRWAIAGATAQKRPWGPEQAVGPPDTHLAGDIQTAWASRTPDGQDEWLRLHYDHAVVPAAVQVYETFNPGALYRITARKPYGSEVELWSGDDPVKPDAGMGVACIPVKADFATDCITIYLKSTKVPGWNEIDAVGLVDQQNSLQWAASAEASSTFADTSGAIEDPSASSAEARIANLETQVRQLSAEVQDLRRKLDGPKDR
jgi:hypothetical protein